MAYDKTATIEQVDGLTLIRGMGLLRVLGRFGWARRDERGVLVPPSKADEARAELESAGWDVVDYGELRQDGAPRRMPLPLPECANCHQPYRRAAAAQITPSDHCVRCGVPLRLIQHDPTTALDRVSTCPECTRPVQRGWLFCRCGAQLDEPTRTDTTPRPGWRERYAAAIAQYAEKFALPDDVK